MACHNFSYPYQGNHQVYVRCQWQAQTGRQVPNKPSSSCSIYGMHKQAGIFLKNVFALHQTFCCHCTILDSFLLNVEIISHLFEMNGPNTTPDV